MALFDLSLKSDLPMAWLLNNRFLIDLDRLEILDHKTGLETHLNEAQVEILQKLIDHRKQWLTEEELVPTPKERKEIMELRQLLSDTSGDGIHFQDGIGYQLTGQLEESSETNYPYLLPPFSVLMMLLMVILGIYLVIRFFPG